MTFTARHGEHRCDHCGLRVGRTWRDKQAHECPAGFRPATPRPVKTCEHTPCQEPIEQRADETTGAFRRRRFCDRTCARRAAATTKKRVAA